MRKDSALTLGDFIAFFIYALVLFFSELLM